MRWLQLGLDCEVVCVNWHGRRLYTYNKYTMTKRKAEELVVGEDVELTIEQLQRGQHTSIDYFGYKCWKVGRQELRVSSCGDTELYWDGELHCSYGPATRYTVGGVVSRYWYVHGKRHRLDGPAVEGVKRREWWVNGQRHREGAPAIICGYFSAQTYWYRYGRQHRFDGPATEINTHTGRVWLEWRINGGGGSTSERLHWFYNIRWTYRRYVDKIQRSIRRRKVKQIMYDSVQCMPMELCTMIADFT